MSKQQKVSELAYHLWRARGCPEGSSAFDWEEAERQIDAAGSPNAIDESLADTFPASDPVASHLPDVPPSNAPKKRAAKKRTPKS